jgi:type I restriction enzyme M protein
MTEEWRSFKTDLPLVCWRCRERALQKLGSTLLKNDMLEAIIQLPTDLFYNTGIATYIWLVTKNKPENRKGKVQLIDAGGCYSKRRKNIGDKRVDLSENCIDLIVDAFCRFDTGRFEGSDESENGQKIYVESKVFDNQFFGYTKVAVETAQADANGSVLLKKGKKMPVKGETDYEIVPLSG